MGVTPGTGRACGSCQLCCKLVPVATLGKKAGVRCLHQQVGKGCSVYASRPLDCRTWSCEWLRDPAAGMGRPDRTHYVVDELRDVIRIVPPDGGEPVEFEALQVWLDRAFPDAWHDPKLLRYVEHVARTEAAVALVRTDNTSSFVILAPRFTPDGRWFVTPPVEPNYSFGRYAKLPSHKRPPL